MISGEENHRDTSISKFSQLALQSDETPWYRMLIFEPEVENVTHQINGMCIVPDTFQPSDDFLFAFQAVLPGGRPQMKI
jgi:hypothetical protein